MLHLQNLILEMVAKGASLEATANRLCSEVEKLLPDVVCSVLSVDPSGLLHPLSAPSLPDHYSEALDGLMIGPNVGSCGTAAYLGTSIAVTDIESDLRWANYKALALPLGLKACWSSPICNGHGKVIGTFAFYYRQNRGPDEREREVVNTCVHLCAIALERHEYVREWERRAHVDVLTNLANRAAFDLALSHLPCTTPGEWALALIDLDNLKVVNDTFGHLIGDRLLQEAAARIAALAAPDKTFRLGGDEFAVLVQSPDALGDLEAAAKRILLGLSEPADCGGHIIVPQATAGGAVFLEGDEQPEMVRRHADFALYHAKETRRGDFVLYWAGIGTAMLHRLRAIEKLDSALLDHRIEAYYQPILDLNTHEIAGLEALCRLKTPDGEVVPAAAFHEATSDAHVASRLTERMVRIVAADMRAWLDSGIAFGHVAINVSSPDFYGGRLNAQLASALANQGVPPERVILEVNEAVYMGRQSDVIAREIESIRTTGVRVALDDFGTGFASLTHLLTVPIDIIKIDKSFVDRLGADRSGATIVEALIWIARKLGIGVVAEGIETEQQLAQLRALGCSLGQGYLFSQPVDREAITAMMRGRDGLDRARPGIEVSGAPRLCGARPAVSDAVPAALSSVMTRRG